MKFFITYDASVESGLREISFGMTQSFEDYFSDRFYDDSGIELAVVLMCRDPRWNFKQRIRFAKKENCLYMDVMLDLDVMSQADPETRKRVVSEKIVTEVPQIIAKKKFKDFDLPRFTKDLREWFEQHGWIEPMDFPEYIE